MGEATRVQGKFIRDVTTRNRRNFRVLNPEATNSNPPATDILPHPSVMPAKPKTPDRKIESWPGAPVMSPPYRDEAVKILPEHRAQV